METAFAPTMPYTHTNSFCELMRIWHSQPYAREQAVEHFQDLMQSHPMLKLVLNVRPCITWILDIRTRQYVFVSENTERYLGYSSQKFIQEGIEFTKDLIHPDDSLHLWRMLRQIWEYLLELQQQQRVNYQFNCEYRLRKADGSYSHLSEQNIILQTDRKGNITHLLGMCSVMDNWKKRDIATASVKSPDGDTCLVCTNDNTPPYLLLSGRQKEIIQLLAQGYNSRQIAEQLCISFHTVTTHRQNIIRKTQCRNTSELIQFAINNGII